MPILPKAVHMVNNSLHPKGATQLYIDAHVDFPSHQTVYERDLEVVRGPYANPGDPLVYVDAKVLPLSSAAPVTVEGIRCQGCGVTLMEGGKIKIDCDNGFSVLIDENGIETRFWGD